MPTDLSQSAANMQPPGAPDPDGCGRGPVAAGEPEQFLSLRDILAMILRRRRAIALFVLLSTLAAGVFFFTRPRSYKAEGFLQIIAPVSQEGRVDRDLFETMIASHLQKISSAFISRKAADLLDQNGFAIALLNLNKKISIARLPRTDLIRLAATDTSPDAALLIVRLWIRAYLTSLQQNNIHAALSQTRSMLKQAQSDFIKKQATAQNLKEQVAQSSPLITLARSVDDRNLWGDLIQKETPDPDAWKRLAHIHIKDQEQSEAYINLKLAELEADKEMSAALAQRDMYQAVERLLVAQIATNAAGGAPPAGSKAVSAEAALYFDALMQSADIIQFGEPGLISASRGAVQKTALFFMAALGLACSAAFAREWCRGLCRDS